MSEVLVATLIHGLNYHVGGKLYTQGYPQIVNEKEAQLLNDALHESQTIMSGQRVAFRRFKIQKMSDKSAALILEKYGEKKQEKPEEKFLIQDAVASEAYDELSLEELETIEAEDYKPESAIKKSPGRPRNQPDA